MAEARDPGALGQTVDDSVERGHADATRPTVDARPPDSEPRDERLRPGAKIGRYEIVKPLGAGAMGIVYLAHDPTLDRPVALKLLRSEGAAAQARLLREGQSAARLAHPNVIRVFDIGVDGDELFIAMEYVHGETLGAWLAAERRPPRAVLELFLAAGRGLAAAHRASLVHRDFKPDNVLLGHDGRVLVGDFGLARLAGDERIAPRSAEGQAGDALDHEADAAWPALTRTGAVLGTPAYMAPEQLRGERSDARSDQFSFCVACWEGLFGRRPFAVPDRATLDDMRRAVTGGVVDPAAPLPGPLAAVERVLRRGLSADPAARYPDLDALLAELSPIAGAAPAALAPGDTVAHYRVTELLGQGPRGSVYRARDQDQRDVAIRVLPARTIAHPDRRARFLRDARAAAAVVHPALAEIYEVGVAGDAPYFASEYVAGASLRDQAARGALPPGRVIELGLALADGLAHAHRAAIVHRDLRLANVRLDGSGAPKLLGLGVAAALQPDAAPRPDATPLVDRGHDDASDRAIRAAHASMAPEQARGHAGDARSDLFAFGAVVFELVCGRPAFAGGSAIDIATAIVRDAPPVPSALAPEIPAELERIILKCLEKQPEDRYQSAADLVVDLRRLHREVAAGTAGRARIAGPRSRGTAVALALAAAALAIAGWLALRPGRDPVRTPDSPRERQVLAWVTGNQDVTLSPDGKSLAVARDGRLQLLDIATGVTRELAPPPNPPRWVRWLPDSQHLLLGMASGPTRLDLVVMPLDGGGPRTLPVHAWGAEISHDGERIATFDEDGLRVSRLDGTRARLLVGTRQEAEFGWPTWSPDDRWIGYSIRGPDLRPQIRVVSTTDGNADVQLVEDPAIMPPSSLPCYTWAFDGRMLYNTYRDGPSALVALDVDSATGRPRGAPVEVASYPDDTTVVNSSRDGRILFNRRMRTTSRYDAELAAGPLIPRASAHQGWRLIGNAHDGAAIYLTIAGTRRSELLAVGRDGLPHTFASFDGEAIDPRLTPDDAAVLYLFVDPASDTLSLRRAPLAGGGPVVVENLPYPPGVPAAFTQDLVAQLGCARVVERGCVLGATEGKEQVFYAVDPAHGRGRRIAALRGPPPWTWDLSPDGRGIVIGHREDALRVVDLPSDLASGAVHDLVKDPAGVVYQLAWVGDTGAVIAAVGQVFNTELRRIDATGAMTAIWRNPNTARIRDLRIHPDGAVVEFATAVWNRSFWLREPPGSPERAK